jgi:hypothetical protein
MTETPNGSSIDHGDRIKAETLIRTSVLALANGAAVGDIDELIRRNASNVSHADVMAGRLNTMVLGDIINTVEQAKGSKPFNWNSATPEQIKAYQLANGISPFGQGRDSATRLGGVDRTGGGEAGGSSRSASVDMSSISAHNYSETSFAAIGLSYSHFNELRAQGFGESQIIAAVNTNKQLGLRANSNPAATARLQRDVPSAIPGLFETHDQWKHVRELERAEKAARDHNDPQRADRLKAEIEQARKAVQEHDKREQGRVKELKPERVPDLIQKQKEIEKTTRDQAAVLSPGSVPVIEAYRRNPQDAEARNNYKALEKQAGRDPKKALALAKVQEGLEKDAALKARETAQNEKKQQKLANSQAEDDIFESIASGPATVKAADAGLVKTAEAAKASETKSSEPRAAESKDASKKPDAKDEKPKDSGSARPTQKAKVASSATLTV